MKSVTNNSKDFCEVILFLSEMWGLFKSTSFHLQIYSLLCMLFILVQSSYFV